MKLLINKGRRRLGIPGRPAIILDPNQSVEINEARQDDLTRNRTVARWLETGTLVITDDGKPQQPTPIVTPRRQAVTAREKRDQREEIVLPEGITGQGTEVHHLGGGWYEVYVNGFKVTDRNVRKDEAKTIAEEYEK